MNKDLLKDIKERKSKKIVASRQPKRITCPQCNLARINGIICHETGCPNSGARYDAESGEWIKQRTCFICGYECDFDNPCCNAEFDELEG